MSIGWETKPCRRPCAPRRGRLRRSSSNPAGAMMPERGKPLTYADSGVDIDVGNRIVDRIRPLARLTRRPGASAELGGFGGLFDLKAAGFVDPILVAANDG